MTYAVAINKSWGDLLKLNPPQTTSVKFLGDEYTVDLNARQVLSLSCNAVAKDFTAILILHYLASKLRGLAPLSGEWVSFKELSGIEGYYPAFRKRAIEPIIRKYGQHPEALLEVLDRLPGKRINQADIGIVLEVFAGVPAVITLWRKDEEFGPQGNMLFDRSIVKIFCTEDIVVLAGIISGTV